MYGNSDHKTVIAAAISASLLMLVFGLTRHMLVAGQASHLSGTPLDPAVLKGFPSQIVGWTGEDIPMSEAIVKAAGADAHINRRYVRDDGFVSVALYIACGANGNEVIAHGPTVCYRNAGWNLVESRSMEVQAADGASIPCFLYEFLREGPDEEHLTVLHYCFANGEYFNGVTQALAKRWRQWGAIGWAAQVQIVASGKALTDDSAASQVCAFARDSASEVSRMFEVIAKARLPEDVGRPVEGK
jgi:hypothetical protein